MKSPASIHPQISRSSANSSMGPQMPHSPGHCGNGDLQAFAGMVAGVAAVAGEAWIGANTPKP
jgi:hypothetical protein